MFVNVLHWYSNYGVEIVDIFSEADSNCVSLHLLIFCLLRQLTSTSPWYCLTNSKRKDTKTEVAMSVGTSDQIMSLSQSLIYFYQLKWCTAELLQVKCCAWHFFQSSKLTDFSVLAGCLLLWHYIKLYLATTHLLSLGKIRKVLLESYPSGCWTWKFTATVSVCFTAWSYFTFTAICGIDLIPRWNLWLDVGTCKELYCAGRTKTHTASSDLFTTI